MGMDINSEDMTSYTTQYPEGILKYVSNKYCTNRGRVLSINSKAYRPAISTPEQHLQDPVNHPLIHMICPVMMKNTKCLTMWLRRHPDEVMMLPAY
jgi:hypothetical protein